MFVISLTLFAVNIQKRKEYNFFDRIILGLIIPPLKISTFCINKSTDFWEKYIHLIDLKQQNFFLQKEVKRLAMENQLLSEQSIENKRLRELLSFREQFSYDILPAEIIGRDPSSWFKTILINRGKSDGVVRGAGVITPQGTVGRVINVTEKTSKVLLITDIISSIDAVIKRSRERGIVEGYTENSCKLSYVLKTESIRANDIIVTTGLHDIFPKGILIGSVLKIIKNKSGFFQFIEIKPSVDFTKLNEVLIVLKGQEN